MLSKNLQQHIDVADERILTVAQESSDFIFGRTGRVTTSTFLLLSNLAAPFSSSTEYGKESYSLLRICTTRRKIHTHNVRFLGTAQG